MAEKVKRRVAAARLAVAFVAAGTIAGATAWAEAGPPPTAQSSASDIFAKIKIDSSNVENGSLTYKDFGKGQVPSFKMFQTLQEKFFSFSKGFNNTYKPQFPEIKSELDGIKGELNTVNGDLNAVKGELGNFVKSGDAIMGDGSVFTATQAITQAGGFQTLLDLPNTIKVEMSDTEMQVTNTSGGTLTFSACTGGAGGGVLQPGKSTSCSTAGDAAQALQMVNGDGKVMTLNFSNLSTPGGSQGTVQILVGL
jgi:hypothetical protein